MEGIISIFTILASSEAKKRDGTYLQTLQQNCNKVILLWAIRFGEKSLLGKKYLHGLSHLREVEKFYLEHHLPTLECYNMQGREHRHKIVGAFKAKHFPCSDSKQRGRKTDKQRETEAAEATVEENISTAVGTRFQYNATKQTVPAILASVPGLKKGKLSKKELIEIGKQKSIKEAIQCHKIELEGTKHTQRTAAFQILARNFRDLECRDLGIEVPDCTSY
jgi:hypothetical protein